MEKGLLALVTIFLIAVCSILLAAYITKSSNKEALSGAQIKAIQDSIIIDMFERGQCPEDHKRTVDSLFQEKARLYQYD